LLRHSGGEKDHRNEYEQKAEKVPVIGYEHQVIVEHDLPERNVVIGKGAELVLDVEHDKNGQDKGNGEKEVVRNFFSIYLSRIFSMAYSL
jgi:hypothetical protein